MTNNVIGLVQFLYQAALIILCEGACVSFLINSVQKRRFRFALRARDIPRLELLVQERAQLEE